jgi:hypothetical protein
VAAGSILREFEAELVLATKQDGYDGGYDIDEDGINNQHVRWSFSGALLFSITVITTIGAYYLVCTYIIIRIDEFNSRLLLHLISMPRFQIFK